MTLDFSGLDAIATRTHQNSHTEPLEMKVEQVTSEALESLQGADTKPQQDAGGLATIKLLREQEDRKNSLAMYSEYQNNIKRSEQLKADIKKGVRTGEAPLELFLKAVECISLMTGDQQYYSQTRQDLKAIWGEGFMERLPLEWELAEVQQRLKNMLEALDREAPPDSKQRIQRAIEAHRQREAELVQMIRRTDKDIRAGA